MNLIWFWNKKGKKFEIEYESKMRIIDAILDSSKHVCQLPELIRKKYRLLNEMYISFMQPTGEIICIQNSYLTLYYFEGSEGRKLIEKWCFESLNWGETLRKFIGPEKYTEVRNVSPDYPQPKSIDLHKHDLNPYRDERVYKWVADEMESMRETHHFIRKSRAKSIHDMFEEASKHFQT